MDKPGLLKERKRLFAERLAVLDRISNNCNEHIGIWIGKRGYSLRLTENQAETIVREVTSLLGNDATVWLFGSRARDNERGGDIDLYAEVSAPVPPRLKARLVARLEQALSNHVDLVIREPGMPDSPIFSIARQTGIALGTPGHVRREAKARLLSRLENQNVKGQRLGHRDELYDDHS